MNKNSLSVTTPTIESCHRINQIDNDPAKLRLLEELGTRGTITLQEAVENSTDGSTAVLRQFDKQLIDEMNKIEANCLVSFADLNVNIGGGVHPFLQLSAKEALAGAIADRAQQLFVNSAYRTIAQQLFLYNYAQSGKSELPAARPGQSNHQSGLAIDIEDAEGWQSDLEAHGWRWLSDSDPVHFDFVGDGGRDIGGTAVLAFQRLWNRHNPNEKIDEDGAFGPVTEEKLSKSPIDGF